MSTTTRRTVLQGPAVLDILHAAGLAAHNVTRNRRTGVYSVRFNAANMSDFNSRTDSADVWAERITQAIPSAVITNTHDSRAWWREGEPVLLALVEFKLENVAQKSA